MTILLTKSDGQIKAKVEKANAGPEPMPIFYALEPVVLQPVAGEEACRDGAVMVSAAPPQRGAEIAGLIVDMSREAFPDGASRRDFLSSLRINLDNPKLTDDKVGRALTTLHRDGLIRKEGKGKATRYFPITLP
jgi:hypothetical protein